MDQVLDQAIEEVALARIESIARIPLAKVIEDNQLDVERILKLVVDMEEED
jgi:hypothetical protein